MIDLRRGIGRIGYVALVLYEVAILAFFVAVMTDKQPSTLPALQLAFNLCALMVGPPLMVYAAWLTLLWVGRGFVRNDR